MVLKVIFEQFLSFRILIGMRDKVRKGDRNGEKDEKL